jgi:hypothetical protein
MQAIQPNGSMETMSKNGQASSNENSDGDKEKMHR